MTELRTGLNEHEIIFPGFFLSLLLRDLSLIAQVCFVANEDDNNIIAALAADVVNPFPGLVKGLGV